VPVFVPFVLIFERVWRTYQSAAAATLRCCWVATATAGVLSACSVLEFNCGRLPVELWDVSGDRRFESGWPAIQKDATGVIIVFNGDDSEQESSVPLWQVPPLHARTTQPAHTHAHTHTLSLVLPSSLPLFAVAVRCRCSLFTDAVQSLLSLSPSHSLPTLHAAQANGTRN
jgi:hypothetical protein